MAFLRSSFVAFAFFAFGFMQAADLWAPLIDMGGTLFPSYLVATAPLDRERVWGRPGRNYLGDVNGQLGIEIVPPRDGAEFVLTVSSQRFILPTKVAGKLKRGGMKYRIYPTIEYDLERLNQLLEPTTERVSFTVEIDGQPAETKQLTANVRSIYDCPFFIKTAAETGGVEIRWMFAAYVNENHPWIDQLLKDALDRKLVAGFVGYQQGPAVAEEQVFAVWNILQNRGIKYSNAVTPSLVSDRVFSQHIRPFEDAISGAQANCVDGSVLMASIFRKIGMDVSLVVVPGHCYLVVVLDPTNGKRMAIETTLLGSADLKAQSLTRELDSLLSGRKNNLSHTTFEHAVAVGAQNFNENLPRFGKEPAYSLVNIEAARGLGVIPLPSRTASLSQQGQEWQRRSDRDPAVVRLEDDNDFNEQGRDTLGGVGVTDLTIQLRLRLGLPLAASGAVIGSIEPQSAAAKAGLLAGDLIVAINGRLVRNAREAVAASTKPETLRTKVQYLRGNSEYKTEVDER